LLAAEGRNLGEHKRLQTTMTVFRDKERHLKHSLSQFSFSIYGVITPIEFAALCLKRICAAGEPSFPDFRRASTTTSEMMFGMK
jgi:hypothetical protein